MPTAASATSLGDQQQMEKALTLTVNEKGDVFCNKEKITLAQLPMRLQTFKAAAQEAEDLATKAKALKAGEGGLYSGDLTEAGVKEIFGRWQRGGAQTPEAKGAKGSVKFWIKDGTLTKYEFNLQGTITIGQDQQEMAIHRTTTVEIKDVDATKMVVPDAAKKKLS